MSSKRLPQSADPNDPFTPGTYLTDGVSLFNVVGQLPHQPSLRLVEDCATMDILMVHTDGLRSPRVRRVYAADPADAEPGCADPESPSDAAGSDTPDAARPDAVGADAGPAGSEASPDAAGSDADGPETLDSDVKAARVAPH